VLTVSRSRGAAGGGIGPAGTGGARPLTSTPQQRRYPEDVETERLHLRQFRADDTDAYERIHSDPEVLRYIGGAPVGPFESWRSMAMHAGHWQLRGYGLWAVELKATGELIGRAGMWFPQGWPEPEAGWTIGREHWNKGYATEAGGEGLRHAFDELGLQHVISLIHPQNSQSIRVAEKLGGKLEDRTLLHGVETLIYGYSTPP
jgi:RimJ/RimL family protein N-acetyltransferase